VSYYRVVGHNLLTEPGLKEALTTPQKSHQTDTQGDKDQSYTTTGITGRAADIQKLTAYERSTLNKNIAHNSNQLSNRAL
jgi:hypothetical protein